MKNIGTPPVESSRLGRLVGPAQRFAERLWFKGIQIAYTDPARWRYRHRLKPPAEDVTVRFLIPLISPAKSNDWNVVCNNLKSTVDALRRQTSSNWTATISGQCVPKGIVFDDKVTFLPYKVPAYSARSDKKEKLRKLVRHAARSDRSDGYVFCLDGDDIPHPTLVEYIVSDNNGHGYYLPKGYLVDFGRQASVGFGIPPNAGHPFHMINGSTNILRFDLRSNRNDKLPVFLRGPHKKTPERVRPFGREIEPVPFPAMLYVFNHGDNIVVHRGQAGLHMSALKDASTDPREFEAVMREFGLSDNPASS